jgi:ProP effector
MNAQTATAPRKVLQLNKQPVKTTQPPKPATKQPTPPLSPGGRARRKHLAIKAATEVLSSFYPVVFSVSRRPLAIGIQDQLFADITAGRLPLSKKMACAALRSRANSTVYLETLATGGPRYNLAGHVDGQVTPEQQGNAQIRLAEKLDGIAAGKITKEKSC